MTLELVTRYERSAEFDEGFRPETEVDWGSEEAAMDPNYLISVNGTLYETPNIYALETWQKVEQDEDDPWETSPVAEFRSLQHMRETFEEHQAALLWEREHHEGPLHELAVSFQFEHNHRFSEAMVTAMKGLFQEAAELEGVDSDVISRMMKRVSEKVESPHFGDRLEQAEDQNMADGFFHLFIEDQMYDRIQAVLAEWQATKVAPFATLDTNPNASQPRIRIAKAEVIESIEALLETVEEFGLGTANEDDIAQLRAAHVDLLS